MSLSTDHTQLDNAADPDAPRACALPGEDPAGDTLIFDQGRPGRRGVELPPLPAGADPLARIPAALRRRRPAPLPEVSEPQAIRHYTCLSRKNFSIDTNFYPLGSCTMKHNPRATEQGATLEAFTGLHPLQEDRDAQGTLSILYELQESLADIIGLLAVSLAPVAGAQGEFTGMAVIHAWHRSRGNHRDTVLVPDSAHGTNPASAVLAGFKVKAIQSGRDGRVDLASLRAALDEHTAALMLTNPNTCGLFETDILEIARLVHEAGALLYYDGANLNAIVGRARPGDMGFDVVHLNLHKTFSTPHGGGGPGAGPVAVREDLAVYLPRPRVMQVGSEGTHGLPGDEIVYCLDDGHPASVGRPGSIGRLHAFQGNVGILIRAWIYIRLLGGQGLREVATHAVLNANYLQARLGSMFDAPYAQPCMHEFILTLRRETRERGVRAFDVSKRLLDFGIHPPTNYFPLLVPECLLIEPTETETKETLDRFVEVMTRIRREIDEDPEHLAHAPHTLPYRRLDEVQAARQINICCRAVAEELAGEE